MDYIKFDYFDKLYIEFEKDIIKYHISKGHDIYDCENKSLIEIEILIIKMKIKNRIINKLKCYIKSICGVIYIDKNIEFTEIKSFLEDIIYNLDDEDDELKDKLILSLYKYKI